MNTSIDLGQGLRIEFDGSRNWQVIQQKTIKSGAKAGEMHDDILSYHGSLRAACEWAFRQDLGTAGKVGVQALMAHIDRAEARLKQALTAAQEKTDA